MSLEFKKGGLCHGKQAFDRIYGRFPVSIRSVCTAENAHAHHPRRGVAAVIAREEHLLVIRRSREVVAPGAYCFPGGAIEPGESEEEAVSREIREELGVAIQPLGRLWQSITPWGVSLAWWDCELAPDAPIAPNPAEVESVCWCTPDEMARLPGLLQSNREFLDALAEGRITLRL